MQINKALSMAALGLATFSVIIAILSLITVFTDAPAPGTLVDGLIAWVTNTGYRTAIILLAASATVYLAKKK